MRTTMSHGWVPEKEKDREKKKEKEKEREREREKKNCVHILRKTCGQMRLPLF